MAEPPSSPPSGDTNTEDALAWYKAQYELLEHELADFRESSRELEAELEKDLDAADKRERSLREKAEAAEYEVEEWKRKYKESKAEANAAQNALEKEITLLRDSNRTQQLKLRDIEVANDDFERQARNTTSSLEDLESKYNVSIEHSVMLEEEVKVGEQEREGLRVEAQRLREELSDLKIEVEILQDKLKKQEARHLSTISTDISVPESPTFGHSPSSTASSPLITTPPDIKPLSTAGTLSDVQDPPSPPMSDASVPLPKPALTRTPAPSMARKSRLPSSEHSITPRAKGLLSSSISSTTSRPLGSRIVTTSATGASRTARTPSGGTGTTRTGPGPGLTTVAGKAGIRATSHKLPSSNSLSHIRSLTAQMQRLEARVQSARSKLPAPVGTPPRASPRSSLIGSGVPSTVTIRSRKRATGSTASSVISGATGGSGGFGGGGYDSTPTPASHAMQPLSRSTAGGKHVPRLSTSGVSRLSFGPLASRGGGHDSESSRPSSRASASSFVAGRPSSRAELGSSMSLSMSSRDMPPPRPMSRASLSGARTPLGRPRSSLGGSMHGGGGGGHGSSMSISGLPEDEVDMAEYRTPSRRGTYSKFEMDNLLAGGSTSSSIPAPSGIPMPGGGARRQSSGLPTASGRRASTNTKG